MMSFRMVGHHGRITGHWAGHNEIPHDQPSVDCLMICVVQQVQVGLRFRMMRRQTGDCIFSWLHHQHPACLPASLVTTWSIIIIIIYNIYSADCRLTPPHLHQLHHQQKQHRSLFLCGDTP